MPTDISTLIKTSIVTPGLFTLLALSITFTMMIFYNVLNREKRQALNISFQLTAPNLVTSRKEDSSQYA